jgi:hypothetical protein
MGSTSNFLMIPQKGRENSILTTISANSAGSSKLNHYDWTVMADEAITSEEGINIINQSAMQPKDLKNEIR